MGQHRTLLMQVVSIACSARKSIAESYVVMATCGVSDAMRPSRCCQEYPTQAYSSATLVHGVSWTTKLRS